MWGSNQFIAACMMALALAAASGCDDMDDQPRKKTYAPSVFFADGASARPLVEGTVPRGAPEIRGVEATGRTEEGWVAHTPVKVTSQLLARGREQYGIFCAPCHGGIGDGDGMVVQRGFPRPPTFHDDRLRSAPDGHLFDVATNGYGKMPAYGPQVAASDRWAVVAYIRALQRSQHAKLDDAPPRERERLEGAAP